MPYISLNYTIRIKVASLITHFNITPSATQNLYICIVTRNYSQRTINSDRSKPGDRNQDDDEGALRRRFEQLAEDAYPSKDDPMAGITKDALPIRDTTTNSNKRPDAEIDPTLKAEMAKILERIQQTEITDKYPQHIAYSKLSSDASKHIRDIAGAKPWTGEEDVRDTALRMLMDKYKPLKIKKNNSFQTNTYNSSRTSNPRRASLQERLSNAREISLDYSLQKHSQPESSKSETKSHEEDTRFKEMYKERLLGPSLLVPTSFESTTHAIKAAADRKIEEARRRGAFDNLPRNQKMKEDYNANSPYINTTEYYLNNILKRQNISPPWIEKQNSVDVEIRTFRDNLKLSWKKKAVLIINDRYTSESLEKKIVEAKEYCIHESSSSSSKTLRDLKWERNQKKYLNTALEKLNDSIRSYNLQAPSPSRKHYLSLEKELQLCYKNVANELVDAVKLWHGTGRVDAGDKSSIGVDILPKNTKLYAKGIISEKKDKEYGLSNFFRDIFSKKTQ